MPNVCTLDDTTSMVAGIDLNVRVYCGPRS